MRANMTTLGLLMGALLLTTACGPSDPTTDGGSPDGGDITNPDGGKTDGGGNNDPLVIKKIEITGLKESWVRAYAEMESGSAAYFMTEILEKNGYPVSDTTPIRVEAIEGGTKSETFTYTGLSPGTDYWLRVKAYDQNDNPSEAKRKPFYTWTAEQAYPKLAFWRLIANATYRVAGGTANYNREIVWSPTKDCPIQFKGTQSQSGTCLNMDDATIYGLDDDGVVNRNYTGKFHFCNPFYIESFDAATQAQFQAYIAANPTQHPQSPHSVANPTGCHSYSIQNESGEYVDGGDVDADFVVEEDDNSDSTHVVLLRFGD